jgi:hypothetical protein
MKIDDIGEVIAVRKLLLRRGDIGKRTVVVKLGMPRQFPDSTDYYAPFQITGIGSGKPKYAGGIDAFQAIQLALKMIGAYLSAATSESSADLSWEGGDKGDLGFPT